jgi:hypothetical protein
MTKLTALLTLAIFFLLGMAYGVWSGGCGTDIKHDGSTGPGYAPYAGKATS